MTLGISEMAVDAGLLGIQRMLLARAFRAESERELAEQRAVAAEKRAADAERTADELRAMLAKPPA